MHLEELAGARRLAPAPYDEHVTLTIRRRAGAAALASGPPTDRLQGWVVTLIITAFAALTRFANLGRPTDQYTPIFDEKHYAPQGWQVLKGGGIEDNPGYGLVVHPPVGKQLIAIGEALFGYTPIGWRFMSAVAGTLLVLLIVRITRRLTRSTLIGAIAGVLAIADGVLFVSSRVGMLDIFLALFATAALGALVVDRDQIRERLAAAPDLGPSPFGPWLGFRWWRFAAGLMLGFAVGTKWSGVYFIAFFGLMCVGYAVAARRAAGVPRPWIGAAVRDIAPSLWALVAIPLGVYLASFAGWFAAETSVYRHATGNALTSLWYYASSVLTFHSELTNSAGNIHPWESKPWTWPMGLRPMLYYYAETPTGNCGAQECVKAVMLIGTPAMWWLALPMLAWALWRVITRRDWRYAAVLTAYGAALLPWFATLDRQMYFFYATAMAPFLIMGLALVLGEILGGRTRRQQTIRLGIVAAYVALVLVNYIWLYPILTALPITPGQWSAELWLPSWR
jgi:dolichyl-phosphate-mannose--protein O-mannosyl transferase